MVFHLLTHLYASIAYALAENKQLLVDSSPEFCSICLFLKTGNFPCSVKDQVKLINHAIKRAARQVHHAKFEFNINKTMHQEIDFFHEKLLPKSNIKWETPIAHIIPPMPMLYSPPLFDYSTLTQRYPELTHCRFFQIQPELILRPWENVLTKKWPCHDKIR